MVLSINGMCSFASYSAQCRAGKGEGGGGVADDESRGGGGSSGGKTILK